MINYDIYYLSCSHYLQEIHHFRDVQFAVENHPYVDPHLFFASAWFKNGATVPRARGRHGGDLGLHIYQKNQIRGVPKMAVPNNHWFSIVFLLKMIRTWGVKWGFSHHLRKHPYEGPHVFQMESMFDQMLPEICSHHWARSAPWP